MPVNNRHTTETMSLTTPELSNSLWRYMDFTRFAAMLVNKGLFLARLDQLSDAHEGWIPQSPTNHYDGFFGQEEMARDAKLRKQCPTERKRFYVSCWHANDDQSDAMWKLYAKETEGVAIRTTFRNLQDSLKEAPQELSVYQVMYVDYKQEPVHAGSMLRACLTKRMPFEHEKEVRVVWRNSEPSKSRSGAGFYVNCKLPTLIEQVYIAPTENKWFVPIVKDILKKYGLTANVVPSDLSVKPRARSIKPERA